ncbi:glycosyltransferase [Patulibacter brassicae]|uniref:Glycosyltransferase n=1 Tax=Patulibacter brassicae TaxID=1705717 RepID=A0ABU4VN35_9ACTN|nr:glycosyltransferase [Patulibacter brassicae]MDX8152356.1 glycosyltransferase [Patulibacter brassicae]
MRVLLWHVHGAWTTSVAHGDHDLLVPVLPDRGPDGRGRARTYAWPERVREVAPEELADEPVDVVVLQRPHERELAAAWLGRWPGENVAALYVEHDAPQGRIAELHHPASGWGIPIAHVTHFNRLMWDCGDAPTHVLEHGIPDPGERFTGELPRAGVVVNEARRRGRVTGTDLLLRLRGDGLPIDLFGIDSEVLDGQGDLPHDELLTALAQRRAYLHLNRWTSLGLSLIEAMMLGLPVIALATTEAPAVLPPDVALVTNDLDRIAARCRALLDDPEAAREAGRRCRAHALERFGLERFLADWDRLLDDAVARCPAARPG